ncbi:hypothetical protein [Dermatobacter hominis]|uniref:hypothetical protein n=1 Tax=Dermatobacter hominis TaxID=2884263 RepID=UPI001D0F8ED4|nr:hypothetical protein [Dermatobacter hominis]UDY36964.1 hypothetical protein LH044_05365 [Dermatobacter hominis]
MTLPDDYLVRRCADHWVIVGPTGLFVVGRSDGDPVASSQRAVAMAHLLRSRLADVLSWVPFVSAVLVADGDRHDLACAAVDMDGLGPLLRNGGPQIGDGALHLLRHHVPGVVQQMELDRGPAALR